MTYLLPTSSGKKLIKGIIRSADKSGKFWFKVFKNRKSYDNYTRYRKDVIIDLPPGKEMLKRNASILIPVEPSENHYREDKCGPKNHDIYINGTVLDYSEDKGTVAVKSVYIRKLTQLHLLYLPNLLSLQSFLILAWCCSPAICRMTRVGRTRCGGEDRRKGESFVNKWLEWCYNRTLQGQYPRGRFTRCNFVTCH